MLHIYKQIILQNAPAVNRLLFGKLRELVEL